MIQPRDASLFVVFKKQTTEDTKNTKQIVRQNVFVPFISFVVLLFRTQNKIRHRAMVVIVGHPESGSLYEMFPSDYAVGFDLCRIGFHVGIAGC